MIETKDDVDDHIYREGVNSFNRFEAFLNIQKSLNNNLYAYACINAFDSSDNTYIWRKEVKKAFSKINVERDFIMEQDELDLVDNLPENITIYRGMTVKERNSGNFGVAWSLDKKIAEFFAYEYKRNHCTRNLEKTVHTLTINKNEVIAFTNDRKESTVFYLPAKTNSVNNVKKLSTKNIIRKLKKSILHNSDIYTTFDYKSNAYEIHPTALFIDRLNVYDIRVNRTKTSGYQLKIELEYLLKTEIQLDFLYPDLETNYYSALSYIQQNFNPPIINRSLKGIFDLPPRSKKLKQLIIEENKTLGIHSIKESQVVVIFKKTLLVPISLSI